MLIAAGVGITSAEERLRTTGLNSGDATSDAISLTANGGLVQYTWHWNPGGSVNPNDVWGLLIDTRITGGSGTMTVVEPRWAVQRSPVAVDTNVAGRSSRRAFSDAHIRSVRTKRSPIGVAPPDRGR